MILFYFFLLLAKNRIWMWRLSRLPIMWSVHPKRDTWEVSFFLTFQLFMLSDPLIFMFRGFLESFFFFYFWRIFNFMGLVFYGWHLCLEILFLLGSTLSNRIWPRRRVLIFCFCGRELMFCLGICCHYKKNECTWDNAFSILMFLAEILVATSAVRPRADVAYCIHALSRRLAKTRNWTVWILLGQALF